MPAALFRLAFQASDHSLMFQYLQAQDRAERNFRTGLREAGLAPSSRDGETEKRKKEKKLRLLALTRRGDSVLVGERLPELGADLVAALASL